MHICAPSLASRDEVEAMNMPVAPFDAARVPLDRAALAWEVLRRDPAYRDDYARLAAAGDENSIPSAEFTARWGLHFR